MNKLGENIYKTARIRSGLKREPVAEELHIDVRTLDKYESLGGNPPDEIVKGMCELYSNSYLGYQHLKKSPLGEFIPTLEEKSFDCATLTMVSSINRVNDTLKSIIEIASDGKIQDNERAEWDNNKKEMMKLVSSLMTLLMST